MDGPSGLLDRSFLRANVDLVRYANFGGSWRTIAAQEMTKTAEALNGVKKGGWERAQLLLPPD